MASRSAEMEQVTREIRACFQRLSAFGSALHADLGITASMRAVMETLHEAGRQTVPAIARRKRVSRQNIQVLVNSLVEAGLVESAPNPADRRSPLIALTHRGRRRFAVMRRRERGAMEKMAGALGGHDLEAARAMLAALRDELDRLLEDGVNDG